MKFRYKFVGKGLYIANYVGLYIAVSTVWRKIPLRRKIHLFFNLPCCVLPVVLGLIPVLEIEEDKKSKTDRGK